MPLRSVAGAGLALLVAALFARLGVWQIHRLGERQARNGIAVVRLAAPPLPMDSLVAGMGDTARLHYRRVRLRGRADDAHELVLAGTSRNGSPGVNLLVPVIVEGRRDAVLVNRGWVYSPDAATVDLSRWREPGQREFVGYVAEFSPVVGGGVGRMGSAERGSPTEVGVVRRMDHRLIASRVPYVVAPFYVIQTGDGGDGARQEAPVRFALPVLDEGPHRGYAVQWFAFAAMAVGGGVVLLVRGHATASARHAAPAEDVG